jgi:hypothetical protein
MGTLVLAPIVPSRILKAAAVDMTYLFGEQIDAVPEKRADGSYRYRQLILVVQASLVSMKHIIIFYLMTYPLATT